MLQGYEMIEGLCSGLSAFMDKKGFERVSDMVGLCVPHFTTHADLNARQAQAKRDHAAKTNRDTMWKGDIARETDSLVTD
jgi:hypothetical protein